MKLIFAIAIALFCAVLGAVAQLLFKLGTSDIHFSISSASFGFSINWKIIIGVILYGLASVFFILALRSGNLSILYPMIATGYVWVTLFSVFVLKEAFPTWKWFGITLILAGVTIIAL